MTAELQTAVCVLKLVYIEDKVFWAKEWITQCKTISLLGEIPLHGLQRW